MSTQVATDNRSLTTEDIIASLAVLLLAGIFILYQTGLFDKETSPRVSITPVSESKVATEKSIPALVETEIESTSQPVEVETVVVEKTVVKTRADKALAGTPSIVQTAAPVDKAIAAAPVGLTLVDEQQTTEVEPAPAVEVAVVTEAIEPQEPAPVVVAEVAEEAAVAPEVVRDIYIERNIETNQIDFSGLRKPATSLQLLINGEATDVFIADSEGRWNYSQALEEGLYSFALQILDVDGVAAKTTPEVNYQVLPVNQSSREEG